MSRLLTLACSLVGLAACVTTQSTGSTGSTPSTGSANSAGQVALHHEAVEAAKLVHTPLAQQFVAQVQAGALPPVKPRELFRSEDKKHYFNDCYTAKEAAALSEAERAKLVKVPVDDEVYYYTRSGSPLSYTRAFELLGERGVQPTPGNRYFDFGYGYVGHLRLLASLGWQTTGVDVDPFLRALYSEPEDQGAVGTGQVTLINGKFPNDAKVVEQVGSGYDVIVSKNVLKKGYIHPDRPAEDRFLIHLGIDDPSFLKAFYAALKPGGFFLIYNICPAPTPADKPFIPWTDGRSPFTKAQWEEAGFEVLVLDQDDTPAIRTLGHALGWDTPGEDFMDLQNDLSVLYTLVRKPAGSK